MLVKSGFWRLLFASLSMHRLLWFKNGTIGLLVFLTFFYIFLLTFLFFSVSIDSMATFYRDGTTTGGKIHSIRVGTTHVILSCFFFCFALFQPIISIVRDAGLRFAFIFGFPRFRELFRGPDLEGQPRYFGGGPCQLNCSFNCSINPRHFPYPAS